MAATRSLPPCAQHREVSRRARSTADEGFAVSRRTSPPTGEAPYSPHAESEMPTIAPNQQELTPGTQ